MTVASSSGPEHDLKRLFFCCLTLFSGKRALELQMKILIIDDDDSLRRVIAFALQESGYCARSAAEGEEGLTLFKREQPQVVITDLQMPGLSGFEVLQRIKQSAPQTLVIVITAFGSVESAVQAMKMGAFDYLGKPFSREELCMVVEKAKSFLGLREENLRLREKLAETPTVISVSEPMQRIMEMVRRVAASEATVLLLGESGTGKEVLARVVHQGSERRDGPFVPVNCAAIPGELLESELFGHLRGAFTGAVKDRKGKFELADGGTLFLDEVAELPLDLQAKMLRALQEREIEPVGGKPVRVDVRIVAATNRDLDNALRQGSFREDLYYRLAVIPIQIPPLRDRPDDIEPLVRHFLRKHGDSSVLLEPKALERLIAYDWPGNVRELENAVERALILCCDRLIQERDLPSKIRFNRKITRGILQLPEGGCSLEELEKEAITEALLRNDWNKSRAAAFLQIPRHILAYRVEKYGIGK